jgi:hypothetical protein
MDIQICSLCLVLFVILFHAIFFMIQHRDPSEEEVCRYNDRNIILFLILLLVLLYEVFQTKKLRKNTCYLFLTGIGILFLAYYKIVYCS